LVNTSGNSGITDWLSFCYIDALVNCSKMKKMEICLLLAWSWRVHYGTQRVHDELEESIACLNELDSLLAVIRVFFARIGLGSLPQTVLYHKIFFFFSDMVVIILIQLKYNFQIFKMIISLYDKANYL